MRFVDFSSLIKGSAGGYCPPAKSSYEEILIEMTECSAYTFLHGGMVFIKGSMKAEGKQSASLISKLGNAGFLNIVVILRLVAFIPREENREK